MGFLGSDIPEKLFMLHKVEISFQTVFRPGHTQ